MKKKIRKLLITLLLTLTLTSYYNSNEQIIASADSKSSQSMIADLETKKEKFTVKYKKVTNGDTAQFKYKKKTIKTKLLSIDAPKIDINQPLSNEAKDRLDSLLSDATKIQLKFGKGKKHDKQKRELVNVWVDGKSVQETLLEEGLVRYSGDTSKNKPLTLAQQKAKENKVNIWKYDGYVTNKGFDISPNKEKATSAVDFATKNLTRDNISLAKNAVEELGGDNQLSKQLNQLDGEITKVEEKEKADREAAQKAEQERIVQEQAAAQKAEEQKVAQEQAAVGRTVYIAPQSGTKYHFNQNCRGLRRANSISSMTENEAISSGYSLCGFE